MTVLLGEPVHIDEILCQKLSCGFCKKHYLCGMKEKEKYIQPLMDMVYVRGEAMICQISENTTESLNEEKFDW